MSSASGALASPASSPGPSLLRPGSWMEARLARPAALRAGLGALTGVALLYAAALLALALGGAQPGPAPWLTIPAERYFFWEALFIAPVIVAGGVLAGGTMHLLARALGGGGSFDDTMALVGTSIGACTLTTAVPDLAIGLLLCAGLVDPTAWMAAIRAPSWVLGVVWVYLLLYLAAFLVAFPASARAAHRLSRGRALAVGAASFAVYQTFLYVFIR